MRTVQESFGPSAALYATSAAHNNQSELSALVRLAAPRPTDFILDIAAGAGNTGLAFAPHCANTVFLDSTPEMLSVIRERTSQEEVPNTNEVLGDAGFLPFSTATFDIVANRLAAHHFPNVQKAVHETRRVLKKGGQFLLVDNFSPEDDSAAISLDQMERLRDPSHHWSLKASEWRRVLRTSGFRIIYLLEEYEAAGMRMEIEGWMERIRTPEENRIVLRQLFADRPSGLNDFIQIRNESGSVSFSLPKLTILAQAID